MLNEQLLDFWVKGFTLADNVGVEKLFISGLWEDTNLCLVINLILETACPKSFDNLKIISGIDIFQTESFCLILTVSMNSEPFLRSFCWIFDVGETFLDCQIFTVKDRSQDNWSVLLGNYYPSTVVLGALASSETCIDSATIKQAERIHTNNVNMCVEQVLNEL